MSDETEVVVCRLKDIQPDMEKLRDFHRGLLSMSEITVDDMITAGHVRALRSRRR